MAELIEHEVNGFIIEYDDIAGWVKQINLVLDDLPGYKYIAQSALRAFLVFMCFTSHLSICHYLNA